MTQEEVQHIISKIKSDLERLEQIFEQQIEYEKHQSNYLHELSNIITLMFKLTGKDKIILTTEEILGNRVCLTVDTTDTTKTFYVEGSGE